MTLRMFDVHNNKVCKILTQVSNQVNTTVTVRDFWREKTMNWLPKLLIPVLVWEWIGKFSTTRGSTKGDRRWTKQPFTDRITLSLVTHVTTVLSTNRIKGQGKVFTTYIQLPSPLCVVNGEKCGMHYAFGFQLEHYNSRLGRGIKQVLIGTPIVKLFDNTTYMSRIIAYDNSRKWYRVPFGTWGWRRSHVSRPRVTKDLSFDSLMDRWQGITPTLDSRTLVQRDSLTLPHSLTTTQEGHLGTAVR